MRNTYLTILCFLISLGCTNQNIFGQAATLPTSWDCNGTEPTGWTYVNLNGGNLFYTSNTLYNSAPSAFRLDSDNEYLQIEVADDPGTLEYYISGSGSGSWPGTFDIEESVNGTAWTTVQSFGTGQIPQMAPTLQSHVLNAASRFIRFYYTDKQSGSNISLDDISISVAGPGPAQEIAISYQNENVPSGERIAFSSAVGTPLNTAVWVKNLGTVNTLQITSMPTITGMAAGDYTITSYPDSVQANDSAMLQFTFTPSMAGTRSASLTINNNDANESMFNIELFGIGGSFATEPATPGGLSFTNVSSYQLNGVVSGFAADGVLVLRKKGSAITAAPADGVEYTGGQGIGDAKVFYVGDGSSVFNNREMNANTDYHYDAYAYNGFGTFINYSSSPVSRTVTSDDGNVGNYYNGIDTTASTFVSDLTSLVNPHTQIFYSNFKSTILADFLSRDTTGDMRTVTGEYSGEIMVYTEPFDFVSEDASREHRLPSSWMPTFGTPSHEDRHAYSDLHSLVLVDQSNINAVRSNNPYGNVVNIASTHFDATSGDDNRGERVFEPRDNRKGDAARAIFYACISYHNASNSLNGSTPDISSWAWEDLEKPATINNPAVPIDVLQDYQTLLDWHLNDPVSNYEIARNDYIDDIQSNRNPFVDHPEYVCYIDFRDMSKRANATCDLSSIDEVLKQSFTLFILENPISERLNVRIDAPISGWNKNELKFKVYNTAGELVTTSNEEVQSSSAVYSVAMEGSNAGQYILEVSNGSVVKTISFVK